MNGGLGNVKQGGADAPAPLQIRLTAETAQIAPARRAIEAFCVEAGFEDVAVGEVGLCVNEAIANIIRHAYRDSKLLIDQQKIELRAEFDCSSGLLRISLRDFGIGIAPGALPGEKIDPLKPGGLGLICLGRLMDKVSFSPQNPGMLLELKRKR